MIQSSCDIKQRVRTLMLYALLFTSFFCISFQPVQAQVVSSNQAQIAELTKLLQTLQSLLAQLIGANTNGSPQEGGFTNRGIIVGSTVQTTDVLKVRTAPGTGAGLTGTKQSYVRGKVTVGPRSANGYTWWFVDFNDNTIDGWVAQNWLTVIGDTVIPRSNPDTLAPKVPTLISSISNSENPVVKGNALNGTPIGFSVGGSSGDKVYGSGPIAVVNGKWMHKISSDLENGTYVLVLYSNNIEVTRKNFTVSNSMQTKPQISWNPPSGISIIDNRGQVKTVYLDSVNSINTKQYDTLMIRWDREFIMDNSASCTIEATYKNAYRSITLKNTATSWGAIGEYVPATERYFNSSLEKIEVNCSSDTDSLIKTLTVTVDEAVADKPSIPPEKNNYSCGNLRGANLAAGKSVCYGVWDYGSAFGEDSYMCPAGGYGSSELGCQIQASVCQSGAADATKKYTITSESTGILDTIATKLGVTRATLKEHMVEVWEYTCTANTQQLSSMAIGVGAYEGTYPTGVTHSGGYHPQGTINVYIGDEGSFADKSLTLVLTAYEPVRWNITGPGVHSIGNVFASGYHTQEVSGLPADVPITIKSHQDGDDRYFFTYQNSGTDFINLQSYIEKNYNTKFQLFYGNYTQNQVNITQFKG